MDCEPTCTRPMVGMSVPKNQNQPTNKQGFWRARQMSKPDQMANSNAAPITRPTGQ